MRAGPHSSVMSRRSAVILYCGHSESRHMAGIHGLARPVLLLSPCPLLHGACIENRFWSACRSAALCCLCAAALAAAAASPGGDGVEVAPAKTSIYVGTVTLTMPPFARKEGSFESTYTAKVFPYFFLSEAGTIRVEVSDAQLGQLARGEPLEFSGIAVRADGTPRRLSGTATPGDARSGRLKVRVAVSKRVELIFNTTYRFTNP